MPPQLLFKFVFEFSRNFFSERTLEKKRQKNLRIFFQGFAFDSSLRKKKKKCYFQFFLNFYLCKLYSLNQHFKGKGIPVWLPKGNVYTNSDSFYLNLFEVLVFIPRSNSENGPLPSFQIAFMVFVETQKSWRITRFHSISLFYYFIFLRSKCALKVI